MTPMDYQGHYVELKVPDVKDDKVVKWQIVNLGKYVLIVSRDKDTGTMTWDSNHPNNKAALDGLLGKLLIHFGKKGATLTTHVKSVDGTNYHVEFDRWQDVWYYAHKSFYGKGSPEDAQITLQLAARFGLLNGGTLQKYCDDYLGLDCNGFVGNYLVHGYRGRDWEAESPKQDYLANTVIGAIVKKNGAAVKSINELVPTNSYLMALVDAKGIVIDQYSGGSFGHIMITQPGMAYDTVHINKDKSIKMVPTLVTTESTGGVGLVSSACQFLDATKDGIFTVKRGSHPHMPPLRFRAFRVL